MVIQNNNKFEKNDLCDTDTVNRSRCDTVINATYKSYVISLLIHQSRAHRGHKQYDHLLPLFYNITRNEEKKTVHGKKKKAQQH